MRCARSRREQKVDLPAALDLFESRTGFLAAQGVEVSRIRFSTAFGRGLDYYTGFVFELHDKDMRVGRQLVAGGRYDELLSRLGARRADPGGRLFGAGSSAWTRSGSAERMSAPFVLAVPSKGRLQENAEASSRARACSSSSRAARANIAARSPACRASRSPISRPPTSRRSSASGAVHFGVTGEDQIRETIPTPKRASC